MDAKISIIVPVYNVELYLKDCIESVLNQTFPYWELILINDGSQDHSVDICDLYAKRDSRIKVIHKENAGVSRARNDGLKIASGVYVMFLDSDDWLHPNMLQDYYQALLTEQADCVAGGLCYAFEEENSTTLYIPEACTFSFPEELDAQYLNLQYNHIFSALYAKLYKKSIIDRFQLKVDERFSILEDGMFVADYFKHCSRICILGVAHYYYRQFSGVSLMKRFNPNGLEALNTYWEKYQYMLPALSSDRQKEVSRAFCNYYLNFIHQIYSRSAFSAAKKYSLLKNFCKKVTDFPFLNALSFKNNKKGFIILLSIRLKAYQILHWALLLKYLGR